MQLFIPNGWWLLCAAFALFLLTSFVMQLLGRNLYTFKKIKRQFSIMDLQFPASETEVCEIVNGIYLLPAGSEKSLRSLRLQLITDFIFMPAAYGSIFLILMMLSHKLNNGAGSFAVLAWLQAIPFGWDVIENIYLLRVIKPNAPPMKPSFFTLYRYMELLKWGISLFGLVCGLSAGLYFWLSGQYLEQSLRYPGIMGLEILMVILLGVLFRKGKKNL